jgi:hypothetical protein
VVPDADTSLAQEEQGSGKDSNTPEKHAVMEQQVSNEEDPKDDT